MKHYRISQADLLAGLRPKLITSRRGYLTESKQPMSKKANRSTSETSESGEQETRLGPKTVAIPEGYQSQSSDIVGVWDSEGDPIHCIPIEAKLSDSKLDANKPSILIFARLVDEVLLKSTETEEDVLGSKDDIVGIWAKPGMSALKGLAGQKVYMYCTGEKDTGKPNPMKTYAVMAKAKGSPLPVTEDRRDKSRHVATFLTPGNATAPNGSPKHGADDVSGSQLF